jgi:hypothetical protein
VWETNSKGTIKRSIQIMLLILEMLSFSGCDTLSERDQETSGPVKFANRNDCSAIFEPLENSSQHALIKNDYPEERIVIALNFEIGSVFEGENE